MLRRCSNDYTHLFYHLEHLENIFSMKKYSYEANHNKFSILNFLPPLIFWAIKLNIMETAGKLAEKVKLKTCLPPIAQANTITYFS